jgi:hypothetical protein
MQVDGEKKQQMQQSVTRPHVKHFQWLKNPAEMIAM